MIALLCFVVTLFASPFKSKSRLEAENAALRRQLIILQRKMRGRVHLTNWDRLFLVQLYRWFPSVLKAITIIRPLARSASACRPAWVIFTRAMHLLSFNFVAWIVTKLAISPVSHAWTYFGAMLATGLVIAAGTYLMFEKPTTNFLKRLIERPRLPGTRQLRNTQPSPKPCGSEPHWSARGERLPTPALSTAALLPSPLTPWWKREGFNMGEIAFPPAAIVALLIKY
jgi:hypothetical protein